MKKKVRSRLQNQLIWINDLEIQQILPDKFFKSIGPFILLDHISSWRDAYNKDYNGIIGKRPVPRRGVAVLTYIISGEVEHLDSIGNHVKLGSGSAHWLNAGKGVVCDETIKPEFGNSNINVSVVRCWINLPSKYKSEAPEYLSLRNGDIPKLTLDNEAGWIKILCGDYNGVQARIPCYSKHFLYHIHIGQAHSFSLVTDSNLEYAAFLPTNNAIISELKCQAGEFIVFSSSGELIEIKSNHRISTDILLLGGERYDEPIVLEGTFAMNNPHEITQAYNDYYDGKYGNISNVENDSAKSEL